MYIAHDGDMLTLPWQARLGGALPGKPMKLNAS